ncbi:hypothetical protein CJU90_1346 [Yarrowia sp. C11]|nr:hypothetical protein CKK34_0071 [Yarrowia sp. E02]KAG5371332.1 hypothetical protein CJU90_1346 [Yarrowia sp. C11]
MADPHRRFAIQTDLSRFERLRRGLRREEDVDINLGASYSRYRLVEPRRNTEEEEIPETRNTRVSKRDRDHKEQSTSNTRLRSNSRSRNTPPRHSSQSNPINNEGGDFEDEYPEIKQEVDSEDMSMYHPMPQLRRYAGYNAVTGSPQKKVTITEPQEEPQERHTRPRSRSSDPKAEARIHETTRLVEDKLEQYMGAIEASKGPEVAQQFVREYQLMMDLLSQEYQGIEDAKRKESAKAVSKPVSKPPGNPVSKPTTTKKGIIKNTTKTESRRPAEAIYDHFEEELSTDKDHRFDEERPRVKIEQQEQDSHFEKDNRKVQESMHGFEREIIHTPTPSRDRNTLQKVVISKPGIWERARSTISRSCRTVTGAWYTTTSPLLLLATSFFFWQAIRLALTFFCLDDDEEFVRQQLVQGMSYAEIEHMWGLRGFNICGGVWRPPVPQ